MRKATFSVSESIARQPHESKLSWRFTIFIVTPRQTKLKIKEKHDTVFKPVSTSEITNSFTEAAQKRAEVLAEYAAHCRVALCLRPSRDSFCEGSLCSETALVPSLRFI
jgi:ribosomal protein L23